MRKTLLIALALTFFHLMPAAAAAPPTETGYFLSNAQKGQLIGLGRMQDSAGVWYDVQIVPGYVPPTRMARKYMLMTADDFAEYVSAKKYRDLGRQSGDAFKWAYNDALVDFTLKGTPRAWRSNFATARLRSEKRVFGWWFAYPWALFTSVTDNVFRIPLGLGGLAGGTVWGSAVVPAYHLTDSSLKGVFHFSTGGVILPVVGYAWNTAISPPLALLGQKPAPSRTDGFWVRRLDSNEMQQVLAADLPMSEDDLVHLTQWGRILDAELEPFQRRRQEIRRQTNAAIQQIRDLQEEKLTRVSEEKRWRMLDLLRDPQNAEILAALEDGPLAKIQVSQWRNELREYLEKNGADPDETSRLIDLLETCAKESGDRVRPIEKTDPLQQVINQPGNL
jgi:hypothetical protein